ncbi:hypothetical protein GCM10023338_21400 [Wohlfahrtiimonas larvae]|uniref:Toxin-antitoxin system YwqK family antitoxin n=1 Tax=Wohlfahrtiimonas larvae TaxID=1157986 RepID=A0ABP9MX73_9GAMM
MVLVGGYYFVYPIYQKDKAEKLRMYKSAKEAWLQSQRENIVDHDEYIYSDDPSAEVIITYYPNTQQKKEQFTLIDGKKEGLEFTWREDGSKEFESHYVNGKVEGIHKRYGFRGVLSSEGEYINGLKNGRHIDYSIQHYPEVEREVFYKDGEMHGSYKTWAWITRGGQLNAEATYNNGRLEGEAILYGSTKTFIGLYDNGRLIKSDVMYTTGEKAGEITQDPTQKYNWKVKFWHKNGNISYEGDLRDPKLSGSEGTLTGGQIYYTKDGQKFLEREMSVNQHSGWCRRWDQDGKLIAEMYLIRQRGMDKSQSYIGKEEDCDLTEIENEILNNGE